MARVQVDVNTQIAEWCKVDRSAFNAFKTQREQWAAYHEQSNHSMQLRQV